MKKLSVILALVCLLHVPAIFSLGSFDCEVSLSELEQSRADEALKHNIPADSTFLIVDFKFSKHKKLKILEFGNGTYAGFKVLDHMCGPGKVWAGLWRHLRNFNIPIWYVGNYRARPTIVAWNTFLGLGGKYARTLTALEKDYSFKRLARKELKPLRKIEDYKGIIVLKCYRPSEKTLEKFKKKYPGFLLLSQETDKYVKDKNETDALFDTDKLKKFRPKSCIYPRKYHAKLAEQVINDLKCKWYVIKPIFCGRGNGILFEHKRDLDKVFKLILKDYNNNLQCDNTFDFRPNNPMTYQYWKYDRNSDFLVEEFVPSKPIAVQGKKYDATIRTAFVMEYSGGKIRIKFFDSYWKRPIKGLKDKGTFREKHLSKHAPNYYQSIGWRINSKDLADMYSELKKVLPDFYMNMLLANQK